MYKWKRATKINARFPFFHINLKSTPSLGVLLIFIILIVITVSVIAPSATPVNVTSSKKQAALGIYMLSYYENVNAPSSGTSVTVDMQSTIPASSGSYTIQSGSSAYLWTPQFAGGKTIPDGNMPVVLWAESTPSLDGTTSTGFYGTSGTVYLTTTQTYDLIYVVVATDSIPTVSISGSSLAWHTRGSVAYGFTGKIWAFYATANNVLSSASITASLSSYVRFTVIAFGVSGVNTASPFDPNLGSFVTKTGFSSSPSQSVTTTGTNDFLIGTIYADNAPTITVGSGLNLIDSEYSSTYLRSAVEYKNAVDAGTNSVGFSLGSYSYYALIGDALVPSSSTSSKLSVSAYTTTSSGAASGTIFTNLNTNSISSAGGQVSTVFPVSSAAIPNLGYIKIVLTAPSATDIIVYWGNGKPTNIQLSLTYDG
jgi:hypothetical protein